MSESDFPITVWHNPGCGTSRNVVSLVEAAGYRPMIVEYLLTGWDKAELTALLAEAGLRPRDVLREEGTVADELGLLDLKVTDDVLLDAMIAYPSLTNRPLVRTPLGVKLARPSEAVLDLLEHKPDSFTKEDGTVVRLR
jgi:arsenate reductase